MARAATVIYVSMAPEQQIQVFRLEPETGSLAAVEAVSVAGAPGATAVDPKRHVLFASLRSTSTLASFRIDPVTGKLTLVSTVALPKTDNATYVTTDRTGRWLLSASYAGGTVVVHRISDDGRIESPSVQTVTTAKTAHCVVLDRENSNAFVPHVTPNAVFQFRFDGNSGRLSEAGKIAGGTQKAGPRHLAFHPSDNFAFTSDEQGSSVTAYRADRAAGLVAIQTLSTLPADYSGQNSTAEVKVHPSGKFVWVSNRGHDSLAGFSIDAKTGMLSSLGQTPTEKTPRSFDVDPSGQFVIAAGEGSGKLSVYRIDQSSGRLDRIRSVEVGKSLPWVLSVALPGD